MAVSATSTPMTNKKTEEELKQVPCIWYSVTFKERTEAQLNSKSEVNVISQAFVHQLGLKTWKTNVKAQKFDGTTLEIYRMVVFTFSVLNKDDRERFFEESFLLADVKSDVVLGMPFLTMSNIYIDFQAWNLQWRSYTIRNILPTTKQVELIGKKKFVVVTLDPEYKAFVVYIAALRVNLGDEVYSLRKAQIAYLQMDKAPTEVPNKYADFADIFSPKLPAKLFEYPRIHDYTIE